MSDQEERLRTVEDQLEDALAGGGKLHGAKPRLTMRPSRKLEDGSTVYHAEVINNGKSIARDVR